VTLWTKIQRKHSPTYKTNDGGHWIEDNFNKHTQSKYQALLPHHFPSSTKPDFFCAARTMFISNLRVTYLKRKACFKVDKREMNHTKNDDNTRTRREQLREGY
jgi:hypothetical protein